MKMYSQEEIVKEVEGLKDYVINNKHLQEWKLIRNNLNKILRMLESPIKIEFRFRGRR